MKTIHFLIVLLFTLQMQAQQQIQIQIPTKFEHAVPVLNMGTFHMGYTPDSLTTEFDENNRENIRQVMGASHTAFFNDFMRRSPKYKLVDVFEYLK